MTPQVQFKSNVHRSLVELDAWVEQRTEPALEPELPIVDTHHHLWEDQRRGRYLLHELLADMDSGHNIVASVFMEVGAMYRAADPVAMQPVGEVEFVNGIAAMSASGHYGKSRLCAGIVGHANLLLGDEVQPVIEALTAAGNGRLRGIRHGAMWDSGDAANAGRRKVQRYQLLDPTFRRGLAHLQRYGLSFDASQYYPQLPDLADLLHHFPETQVILDHAGGLLGIPPHENREQVFALWRRYLRELVQFPNLTVKIGAFGMMRCGWDFHLRELPPSSMDLAEAWRPYIETCIEAFGPDRCMMESNFPIDKQSCGYGVLWNAFKRITQNYSAAEKTALYSGTAARVYRLAV